MPAVVSAVREVPPRVCALGLISIMLGLLAFMASGCGSTPPEAPRCPSTAASPPKVNDAARLLVPSCGDLFGAWVQPAAGYTASDEERAILSLERALGRRLAINNLYANWAAPLPLAVARWDLRNGTVPMISWGPARTSVIASGASDAQIRARAEQLRSLRGPVMVRWFWEMDDAHNHPYAVSPTSFIAAWRHIHGIFTRAGATNVLWVWCPGSGNFSRGVAQKYYPGDSYVDWVGADGYNWAPGRAAASWRSFSQIFSGFYRWGMTRGKPMLIGEYGVMERGNGEKAAWYTQADQQLRTQFPAIRGIVYFDSRHFNAVSGKYFNWRVTSSPSALAAFRVFARDPYFSDRPPVKTRIG